METLYKIISNNPEYFAWAFGIINTLWIVFIYFNRKRHEHELESLKHSYSPGFTKIKISKYPNPDAILSRRPCFCQESVQDYL